MGRLIRKGLLFSLPFLLYATAVVVVDPFEYFGLSDAIAHPEKERISGRMNYALWKSQQFMRTPARRVLFGDSRMGHVEVEAVEAITGKPYFNFSFGGGTVPEMVGAFWFATERVELEEVTFGLALFNFNARQNMDRFDEALRIEEEPALYFINRTVAQAMATLLWGHFVAPAEDIERPPMNREEFWVHQLDAGGVRVFGQFAYAESFETEVEEVVHYCDEHSIPFRFVVPPSHIELQDKISEFGLMEERDRFLAFLRRLAPTVDFDVPSDLTRDASRFGDPFHPKMDKVILSEIWGGERGNAVHTRRGESPDAVDR